MTAFKDYQDLFNPVSLEEKSSNSRTLTERCILPWQPRNTLYYGKDSKGIVQTYAINEDWKPHGPHMVREYPTLEIVAVKKIWIKEDEDGRFEQEGRGVPQAEDIVSQVSWHFSVRRWVGVFTVGICPTGGNKRDFGGGGLCQK